MDNEKRERLEAAGWRVGSAEDFLGLSPEEAAFVAFKLSLGRGLRQCRTEGGLTQAELARRMGSSQSRIARAEASDPGVTVDFQIRALLAAGATLADLAGLMAVEQTPVVQDQSRK